MEGDKGAVTRAEFAGLDAVDATGAVEIGTDAVARAAPAASLASDSEAWNAYGKGWPGYKEALTACLVVE